MSHYLFLHSAAMDGPSLLKALMDAAGDNAYAVATSLRKPALQSYIWKFLNGKAKEPRRASLQPLADRYRVPVDAFYDAGLAERLAIERGLLVGRSGASESASEHPQEAPSGPGEIEGALRVLAEALAAADEETRAAVASLFARLAQEPERLESVTATLMRLLPERKLTARNLQDDQREGRTITTLLPSLATKEQQGAKRSPVQSSGRS
jgi:transcriptional regulator with XRE-family HTH domain